MKIIIREINYKEVEVPIDTTIFDVQDMIRNCEVIVDDTVDTDYEVKLPESEDWEQIF